MRLGYVALLIVGLRLYAQTDATGYNFYDSPADATSRRTIGPPWMLPNPTNVEVFYELTPDGKGYWVYERVGGRNIRPPSYITREEYERLFSQESQRRYLDTRSRQNVTSSSDPNRPAQNIASALIPPINVNSELFKDIFGSGKIDIRPNINVLLDFSLRRNRIRNPAFTLRQQRNTQLAFNQQIQMNVIANIGEKLRLRLNWDTQTSFTFENQFKLEYQGYEDDIIKSIEAGNVGLPLGSTLITGGQNLWGIKTRLQFGSVFVTALASQQRSKSQEVVVKQGGQRQEKTLKASNYDFNRHFFLSHYFRSRFEDALRTLPIISAPVNILRVEIWITNRANAVATNTRNIVGLVDLGENLPSEGGVLFNSNRVVTGRRPSNDANDLYNAILQYPSARNRDSVNYYLQLLGLRNSADYELVENMRRLSENEYVLHRQLGYVSLNVALQPNDVVFVAYEYTVGGDNTVYRVGEFSNDQPADPQNTQVLFLKMLKPSAIRPVLDNKPYPTWDLMMKNIYRLDVYNLRPDGFDFQIFYEATDGSGDINYLPSPDLQNKPLLQVFKLDQLRNNMEQRPDNVFDYVVGATVVPQQGLVVFPVLEPFGKFLASQFVTQPEEDSVRYVFDPLYRMTQVDAVQYYPQLDRFKFKISYLSATGAEINLNAVQIQPGSVRVTAGGAPLTEGTDYQVDYTLGKVTILNQGILQSGQEIRVRYESNVLFGIDQKTLVGARVEWRPKKNFTWGFTGLSFYERPLIQKVIISEEPAANLMWGTDLNLEENSRFVSALLSKLPFYSAKDPTQISFKGEFAQLRPGIPKQVQFGGEKGIAYIDDFEGIRNALDLTQWSYWKLASTPPEILSTISSSDPRASNFTRAALSWYFIDPDFFNRPSAYGMDDRTPALNSAKTRRVEPQEVFPNRTVAGMNILTTFDLYYRPNVRGPYNYNALVADFNPDGTFRFPERNWAGIMRRVIGNTDFEAANYEFIEFWLMDPYLEDPNHQGGEMHIQLGRVSEDVLPDGRRSYEHGLPTTAQADAANQNLTITPWGRVSNIQIPTWAFDNDPQARQFQDVGLDGLSSTREREFFQDYLNQLQGILSPEAYAAAQNDPSSDDFAHFRDFNFPSILERYERFSHTDGNSPIPQQGEAFTRQAEQRPDVEDINLDGTLNTIESYFDYTISLRPSDLTVGRNYIVDKREQEITLPNGSKTTARWYQFRIPLRTGVSYGGIQDFKAIEFIRLYLTRFREPTVLRFGKFELVATTWRTARVNLSLQEENIISDPSANLTSFELGIVNIEENGTRQPFPYVLPPGIQRQPIPGSPIAGLLQNEQSMVMRTCNLSDGDGRGAFRTFNYDLRYYDELKFWVHAEPLVGSPIPPNFNQIGDATLFIRLGTDYSDNYYEYELPLPLSVPGDYSPENIWKEVKIQLSKINLVKVLRDEARAQTNFPLNRRYEYIAPDGAKLAVIGTPQLNNLKTILIGIRNPDDGRGPICVEVWVNELRVTGYNTKPSWSAAGTLNMRLADLGNLSFSGSISTPWYGSIEQKVSQRSTEWMQRYTITGGLQLHKLLPPAAKVDIPFFFTYGEATRKPLFSPYDPDVLLVTRIEAIDPQKRGAYEKQILHYTRTYSYTFANVRLLYRKPDAKKRFWHIQNWAAGYGYNETFSRTPQIEYAIQKQYNANLTYSYNFNVKKIAFFPNAKVLWIRELHFFPLPRSVAFRVEGDRQYHEQYYRIVQGEVSMPPVFYQNFLINRQYNVRWDFTQALSVNYTATVQARVDEPQAPINTREKRDSLWQNFFSLGRDPEKGRFHRINFGRTLSFQQNITTTYRLPLDKFSFLSWVNSSITYNVDYRWTTAPLGRENLGNTIANTQNIQNTTQLQMAQLYKKIPFIDRLLKPIPKKNIISKADSSRKEGDDPYIAARSIARAIGKLIFSMQTLDITYSRNQGTTLPGYVPRVSDLGLDWKYRDTLTGLESQAPGWDFILGRQPQITEQGGWLKDAAAKGWFTRNPRFAVPFQQNDGTQLSLRTSLSPTQDMRIDLNFNRNQNLSQGGLFNFDTLTQDFILSNRNAQGSLSMSFFSFGSAFQSWKNPKTFNQFVGEYRYILSQRLRLANASYESVLGSAATLTRREFWNGYTGSSQDVLVLSFLAAYGPYNPNRMALTPLPSFPLPNWTVNYTGLSQIEPFRSVFRSVTLNHTYRSTYNVNYLLNLRARDLDNDGFSDVITPIQSPADSLPGLTIYNFEPLYIINAVSFNETFTPLVGVNITWKNGLSTVAEYRRSRLVTLNVGALQLNESRNNELSLTLNWRRESFLPSFSLFGRTFELRNAIVYRFEVTYRDLRNQNRRLDTPLEEPIGGTKTFTIKPSIDYTLSTQLTLRVYVEHTRNTPVLSNSPPTSFTAFGVQFRFTLLN
ncbi:MAG: T9SS outer membrane translocon Sov/SprA [Bacteroidia bacterium]